MSAPKLKCFCKPPVENCPRCTKPNWAAIRPSNGDAARAVLLRAKLRRKLIAIAAVLQVAVVTPRALESARILAACTCLSNRTGLEGYRPAPPVSVPTGPTKLTAERPVAPSTESSQARANRLGIPGGFTVLEWAILNSGKR